MRRHLTSIRITYRYRELYDVYEKSAEGEPSHVQFRRLDASQASPSTRRRIFKNNQIRGIWNKTLLGTTRICKIKRTDPSAFNWHNQ